MKIGRIFRHLFTFKGRMRRTFDAATRAAIQEAITASEKTHRGEIRFAVESRLDLRSLMAGETADQRALEVFGGLGVWDTEENSGILVYVLLADHHVAIVADRGYREKVTHEEWRAVCARMEEACRDGEFRRAAVEGVLGAARHAAEHFPLEGHGPNELPDAVVFL
ncbi:MAG: TPM domain-containing protein [Gemmatimonadota bacterium]|jgi:uncharacterized membrane protein